MQYIDSSTQCLAQFNSQKHNEYMQMFQLFLLAHAVLVLLAADIVQLPLFKLYSKPRQNQQQKPLAPYYKQQPRKRAYTRHHSPGRRRR